MRYVLGLTLLSLALIGCGSEPPVPPIDKWITYDSLERYTILLPNHPLTYDKDVKGIPVRFAVREINPELGVVISSSELPAGTLGDAVKRKAFLAKYLKDLVGEGKLLEQKEIPGPSKLTGLGYRATTSLQGKSKEGIMRGRIFFIDGRLINVMLIGSTEMLDLPEISACLDSIKLKS